MFLEQWVVLEILLLLLCGFLKQKKRKRRILAAAAAGSLLGCLILLLPLKFQRGNILLLLPAVLLTVRIAFRISGKKLFYVTGYLLAVSLMFGGIWDAVHQQTGGRMWLFELFFSSIIFLLMYKIIWRKAEQQREFLYYVRFQWQQVEFQVCGFLDTGNFLYEPIGKMPVSVMEETVFLEYFKEPFTKILEKYSGKDIRMIPYHSVGTENGIMPGLLVTNLRITNGSQRMEVSKGVVGISKETLSESGQYQMLLHPDLIKCGRL